DGLSPEEAARRVLVLDSRGLLTTARGLTGYKADYAQPADAVADWAPAGRAPNLVETVRGSGATVLLGLSGQPGAFDEEVVRAMCEASERPIIFPLSNPTSASEATPVDLFRWSDGRAIVATGSPFDPVVHGRAKHPIGQGNNVFIFPGLGLGTILANARRVSDAMVLAASAALAEYTTDRWKDAGLIYPPVSDLAEASVQVATAVLRQALAEGNGALEQRWVDRGALDDLEGHVRIHVWKPRYLPVVAGEHRPF
ncbi:MAG: NAD-dependent malic enzyme, partial [Deltaproteobacteria bacterium]